MPAPCWCSASSYSSSLSQRFHGRSSLAACYIRRRMSDLTLAQATAKGWVVEQGPATASASGGPCTLRKEYVLSGATISGRTPVTMGYHIGTGASADTSIKN